MTIRLTFMLALFGSVAGAQADDPVKQDAVKRFAALEAGVEADMQKYREDQRKKFEAAREMMEKAKREGRRAPSMPAMRMGPPTELIAKHMIEFEKAAADYAGTDDAIMYLSWIVRFGCVGRDKEGVAVACNTLAKYHFKSQRIVDALMAISHTGRLLGSQETERMLRSIEEQNPDPDVKARAILARVTRMLQNATVDGTEYAGAKAEALRAAKIAKDPDIKRTVKSAIAGREQLIAGKVAADIVGIDMDGNPLKLSDYKGKIIMLDFWGDW